jgi:predicted dienelactone hydrolase
VALYQVFLGRSHITGLAVVCNVLSCFNCFPQNALLVKPLNCLIEVVTKAVLTVYKQASSFVGDVYVPALWQHPPLNSKRRYPVVIFSHGIGGNRTCYNLVMPAHNIL